VGPHHRPAGEIEREAAVFGAIQGGRRHAGTELDRIALAQALGVADERAPASRSLALVERRADSRFPTRALELRRNHPRVVEHQQITRRGVARHAPQESSDADVDLTRERSDDEAPGRAVLRRGSSRVARARGNHAAERERPSNGRARQSRDPRPPSRSTGRTGPLLRPPHAHEYSAPVAAVSSALGRANLSSGD